MRCCSGTAHSWCVADRYAPCIDWTVYYILSINAVNVVTQISFADMMTAIFTMLLGALGIGQALMDMGDQRVGLQAARRIFQCIDEGEEKSGAARILSGSIRVYPHYDRIRTYVLRLLGAASEIDGLSAAGEVPDGAVCGRIELRGVNFCYPTRPDVRVSGELHCGMRSVSITLGTALYRCVTTTH
jgi:hypothetical protein